VAHGGLHRTTAAGHGPLIHRKDHRIGRTQRRHSGERDAVLAFGLLYGRQRIVHLRRNPE